MKNILMTMSLLYFFALVILLFHSVAHAENIDPNADDSQYAYGENVGWLNAEPLGDGEDGVDVGCFALIGYIWAENIGWINLNPASYGGVINDGIGNLSGYAWGENVGWINFNPANGGVTIDSNGEFDGWAWGENIGWTHFRNLSIPYKVQTAYGVNEDSDEDGVIDFQDNCLCTPNLDQGDSYPPGGNNCGDACECEGNFDGDEDQDGSDAFTFKVDFGRSPFRNPCIPADPCNGNFNCDEDVDGSDAFIFKEDFGRSLFLNPCPNCVTIPWCD
jgi:hypothetical protein